MESHDIPQARNRPSETRRKSLKASSGLLTVTLIFALNPIAQADESEIHTAVDLDNCTVDSNAFEQLINIAMENGEVPSENYVAQAEAQMVADIIQLAVQDHDLEGFTMVTVEQDKVSLHWSGHLPTEITEIIDGSPIDIVVYNVPNSRDELMEAKYEIIENPPTELPGEITSVGTRSDGNGINIRVESLDEISTQEDDLPDKHNGISLNYEEGPRGEPAISRWDDEEPYSGGSAVFGVDTGYRCTTGFGVRDTHSNLEGMLTAAHCIDFAFETPTGDPVGSAFNVENYIDAQVISYPGTSYSHSFYVADYLSPATRDAWIVLNPGFNSLVYPSGAGSGEYEKRVTEVDMIWPLTFPDGTEYVIGPGFRAESEDGVPAVGAGDSGGPVYFPAFFDDPSEPRTVARGIISTTFSASEDHECRGITQSCSNESGHMNINQVESALEWDVLTTD